MKRIGKGRTCKASWLAGVAGVSLAVSGFGGAANAQAADEDPVTVAEEAAEGVDDDRVLRAVVTTGSRIRGIDSTGSNVITVGQADLENTSVLTIQDLLNQIPQVVGSGFNESTFASPFGGLNVTRGGAVNLRGVGPAATLPLLNGHRIVASGSTGASIDPSVMPTNAIKNIEVIADGASAIYGADAVAGVFNVVLRRDLDGFEASSRYGVADEMDQWAVGFAGGKVWDSGQLMVSYEHTYRSELEGVDRDWYMSDNTANGGTDFRSRQCNPGTIIVNGVTYAVPAGGLTPSTVLLPGTENRCENMRLGGLLPSQERDVVAATFTQKLTDWIEFEATGLYMDRQIDGTFVAQGPTRSNQRIAVPLSSPFVGGVIPTSIGSQLIFGAGGPPFQGVYVDYSFVNENGAVPYTAHEETYEFIGGFNIDLPNDWNMWLGGVYGENTATQSNPTINPTPGPGGLFSAARSGTFNPFGPNSQAVLDGIFGWEFAPGGSNELQVYEARADGPVFEVPAGTVRAAVGVEHSINEFEGGTAFGPPGATPNTALIKREVDSVYGEVHVPLIDNDELGSLALSGALRYDDYSDFGSTTNSKLGLSYEPNSSLKFNASYGTSFRAPTLVNTLTARGGSQVTNGTRPDANGNAIPIVIIIAGNPDLGPETATTWSFGGTYEPDSFPGFRASLNYFNLDYQDQVRTIQIDPTVLTQPGLFGDLVRPISGSTPFDPAVPLSVADILLLPDIQAMIAAGLSTRNVTTDAFYLLDARPYNIGATMTDGIDFDFSYASDFASGSLNTSVRGVYVMSYDVQRIAGAATANELNNYQAPLEFKFRGSALWTKNAIDLGAYLNYSNAYDHPTSSNNTSVDSYTTIDLHGALRLGERFGDTTLALDVQNVFNEDPPFIDLDGAYDPNNASPIGRMITLSVRTRF